MIKAYKALPFLNDPKRIAEDERLQEIRKASFTRANLTDEERLIAEGKKHEEIALANLNLTYHENVPQWQVDFELARWADGLAMQGRYTEAAEIHPEKQEHYQMIADAIERDDAEDCDCKPQRTVLNGKEVEIGNTKIASRVYSHKHGKMIALEMCTCGHANARPLTGQMAKIDHVRQASMKAGKAISTDAVVLK